MLQLSLPVSALHVDQEFGEGRPMSFIMVSLSLSTGTGTRQVMNSPHLPFSFFYLLVTLPPLDVTQNSRLLY